MLILMIVWDAGACAAALTAHPLRRIASYQRKMGIFGNVGICSRRFACRESCYVNRQVCILKSIFYIKIPYCPVYEPVQDIDLLFLFLRGPAVLRGYFFIYRVLSTSLLSGIKCTMWNYMTPPSSPHPPKNTPHPPFYGKKKVFFKNYLLLC